jgi:glycosyltransferase involved in cell wall biosynthesis
MGLVEGCPDVAPPGCGVDIGADGRLGRPLPLSDQAWRDGTTPLVSVHMLAYKHQDFIEQAIRSVIAQITDFPVELVIGEDCSPDGTRRIVERYARAYPDLIRPVLHDRNVGAPRNSAAVLTKCRGRYVAFLEGDDYWLSPDKLQKQVAFLEAHPDCSICGSRFVNVHGSQAPDLLRPSPMHKELGTLEDILRWNYLLTCTVMFRRNRWFEKPRELQGLFPGDMTAWIMLAQQGTVGFINEVLSAYRLHPGGIWTGSTIERRIANLEDTINGIHRYLGNRYPGIHRASLCIRYVECAGQYIRAGDAPRAFRWLLKALAKSPGTFLSIRETSAVIRGLFRVGVIRPATRVWRAGVARYHAARIRAGAVRRKAWVRIREGVAGNKPGDE